ncbi:hypothetical protein TL16_g11897 [Triparma laevis f. inornata]|uniref:Glycosyltransferase 2-like domain-containing protein n=1 Tax=Triparma laevis f. inornata TaxID=1714386 RepID=A0A9W7BMZ9_9STRA|nr:hypothetical protein TL16_g11897 [Triparma laevis f. inornata]
MSTLLLYLSTFLLSLLPLVYTLLPPLHPHLPSSTLSKVTTSGTLSRPPTDRGAALKLSIVVPAYNEESRLKAGLTGLITSLKTLKPNEYEIIVCNDGSKDGTSEECLKLGSLHPNINLLLLELSQNAGKGGALKSGTKKSSLSRS